MILAVMTRATRGHTGRALGADRATALIYVLASSAAAARIAAALSDRWVMTWLALSAALWVASFAGFGASHWRMLTAPRHGS